MLPTFEREYPLTNKGITPKRGLVRANEREAEVDFLVDSGPLYTLLPHNVWTQLGLAPTRAQTFVLGDGSSIERGISSCELVLPEGTTATPVVLGELSDDQALLGVVTLEELGLVLNPMSREIYKAPTLPMR